MKRLYSVVTLLIITILLITTSSCGIDGSQSGSSSNEYVLYIDNNLIENDKIKVELESSVWGFDNYSLSITAKVTNKEYSTNTYQFKNMSLIKEDTKASYTIGNTFSNKLKIEAELKQSISFSATIPTSIKDDHYKFYFELDNYKVIYFLYETPDELRANRTISYNISGEIVHKDIVKDKRNLENKYVYESDDNLYYCDTWYTDSNFSSTVNYSNLITEDIVLYGKQTSIFNWSTLSSDVYSFISGVNHVPSNKILIIPSKYMGKEICLSGYAIYNISVDVIYVPKTVHIIYGGNFLRIGNAKILYEGSEQEWKSLFYVSLDVVTNNVVYYSHYIGN